MLVGNVYGVPQTPIKQEFNANRMAAKKEITSSIPSKAPFPVFDNDSNSD
jgi:hypothetical protein